MRSQRGNSLLDIIRGVGAAALCTLLGMVLLALAAGYTGIMDSTIQAINQWLKLLSVITGALCAVRPGGEKGLIKGTLTGVIYMALGLGIISLVSGYRPDVSVMAAELLISAAAGAASGALFANLPRGNEGTRGTGGRAFFLRKKKAAKKN